MIRDDHRDAISELQATYDPAPVRIDNALITIEGAVTAVTGMGNILSSRDRSAASVQARQLLMFCLSNEYIDGRKLTLREVGAVFKPPYKHGTVIHARQQIENLYVYNADLKPLLDDIAGVLSRASLTGTIERTNQLTIEHEAKAQKKTVN
jgi:hypothetical protein